MEIIDRKVVKCWCLKCNDVQSNDSLSKFCWQDYVTHQYALLRPCLPPWGLLLEITPNSLTIKTFPLIRNKTVRFILPGGPPRGGIGSRFPVRKSAISRKPLEFFDFPDPEFTSSSSCQVFWTPGLPERVLCNHPCPSVVRGP